MGPFRFRQFTQKSYVSRPDNVTAVTHSFFEIQIQERLQCILSRTLKEGVPISRCVSTIVLRKTYFKSLCEHRDRNNN